MENSKSSNSSSLLFNTHIKEKSLWRPTFNVLSTSVNYDKIYAVKDTEAYDERGIHKITFFMSQRLLNLLYKIPTSGSNPRTWRHFAAAAFLSARSGWAWVRRQRHTWKSCKSADGCTCSQHVRGVNDLRRAPAFLQLS